MRKQLAIVSAVFLFGLSGMTLFGEETREVKAHVPFPFLVENTTLPAGDYTVSRVDSGESALVIQNQDKGTAVDFLTEAVETKSADPPDNGSLVFDVVSGKHFLSEVWTTGTRTGWKLFPSRLEKQEMKAAGNHISRKTVSCTSMHKG